MKNLPTCLAEYTVHVATSFSENNTEESKSLLKYIVTNTLNNQFHAKRCTELVS